MAEDRFDFGRNWYRFLATVDERRMAVAEASLRDFLEMESMEGLRFLDIGCGSGLFSLAARRLGAQVLAFDYDPDSVAAAAELKRRFAFGDTSWEIRQGSVLDAEWMEGLGSFDIVYAWGVLHHTGDMRSAFEFAGERVAYGGKLFLSIYNEQVRWSKCWTLVKKIYNKLPNWIRLPYCLLMMGPRELRSFLYHLIKFRPSYYFRRRRDYSRNSLRGMSYWHDLVDWCGGYPFEVAKPEAVFDFFRARGFVLERLQTCGGGLGCNQFVFRRVPETDPAGA